MRPAILKALKARLKEDEPKKKKSGRRADMLAALNDYDKSDDPDSRLDALTALVELSQMKDDDDA